MEKKYRLEPFDLERAKAGEPVCTRDGKDVRILCYDRNKDFYPIVALMGSDESLMTYTSNGKYNKAVESSNTDLMMKVETKEPFIYVEIKGEILSFNDVKVTIPSILKTLNYLIIKTYDGKFLKIWKRNLPEREWKEAQAVASSISEGWRCPTRHECIDIYDARFKGLDDALEEIGGDNLKETYWTSEADSDPQYRTDSAVYFNGHTGNLHANGKYGQCSVRPVQLIE